MNGDLLKWRLLCGICGVLAGVVVLPPNVAWYYFAGFGIIGYLIGVLFIRY